MAAAAAPPMDCALVWFRRDLRLHDHTALQAALQSAKRVIPVFIWSPEQEGQFQQGEGCRGPVARGCW
jgi:deoxyribodipyrimidine photo-lyase